MRTRLLRRASIGALALTLIGATAAIADNLVADGDYATPVASNALALGNICAGKTKSGDVLMAINRVGGGQTFANDTTVSVSIDQEGANTSTAMTDSTIILPGNWTDLSNNVLSSDTASSTVTVDTTGLAVSATAYSQTVKFKAAGGTLTRPGNLSVTFTVVECVPSNQPPTAAFSVSPTDPDEGEAVDFTNTSTDNDGTVSEWAWTFGDGGTSTDESPTHTYADNSTFQACLTVTDDDGATDDVCHDVVVSNVAPSLTSSFSSSIDCRTNASLSLSFTDVGVNDNPWSVDIDWGDGSAATEFDASAQGGQPSKTYLYTTPGTYTVTVTVTDKDGGQDTDTHQVNVVQTYATALLAPFDGSSPSNLVTNTMKNGRVVPVKVKIYDECALSYVTDPTAAVTIKVPYLSQTTSSSDPVEIYADAGASSAGTSSFRWSTDGFWIYNLDSKALGLITGNTYRVDAYVDDVRATTDTWALLRPVK
jgi:PKD repeat protein